MPLGRAGTVACARAARTLAVACAGWALASCWAPPPAVAQNREGRFLELRIEADAPRYGRPPLLPLGPAHARRCVELGCRMLSIGLDAWAFQKGLRAVREEYGELFER